VSGSSGQYLSGVADYDQRDGTFWLSDFAGTIYKIVGFQIPNSTPERRRLAIALPIQVRKIVPNPVLEKATVHLLVDQPGKLTVELYTIDV